MFDIRRKDQVLLRFFLASHFDFVRLSLEDIDGVYVELDIQSRKKFFQNVFGATDDP